ncbi:rhomboid family intramembrane serine protease [Oceanobacillus piezotolerans]|uniref:Rhomboid family intramembrane serine protease n=1 Tax=Oceanobacillus piezotolerans TaxID=2448030 RepID=A0A498D645_9BACI|nr:rhomboid family intramembrane serine protease [Oceanobacillus piezotolerans]RLL42135.1 rhomboid family intramembrane serine protease [Oceanobacillus piezotolerans]
MFIRNERSIKEFMQNYPVVSTLVIIHFILWLIIDFLRLPIGFYIWNMGTAYNFFIAQGEYWRLLTSTILHADLMHALFNSFSLVLFGPALEQMLGKLKFLFLYFGAGIIGSLASFIFEPLNYASVGASGAIFGLFGVYIFMVMNRKHLIDQGSAKMISVILAISLIMTFIQPNINILAHLFGFIGGFILAPLVLRNVRPYSPWNVRQHRYHSDEDIQFDPNRWKKKRRISPKLRKNIFWIILGFLALLGLFSRFF